MDAPGCHPAALDGLQYWDAVYHIGMLGTWQALALLCGQSATVTHTAAAALLQAASWAASSLLSVAAGFISIVYSNLYWAAPLLLLAAAAVGLVNLVFPSRSLMAYITRRWPDILFECPPQTAAVRKHKYIVLTISEGPCYQNTPAILRVLKQCSAQATFFITGSQVQHCDRVSVGSKHEQYGRKVLEQMVAEGHELANHGWYPASAAGVSARELRRQLLGTAQLLSEARSNAAASGAAGVAYKRTRWFRPYGWRWDATVAEVAQQHGHQVALGSIWAWPALNWLPWANAMYIWLRAYTGGVIMLQDRHQSTARILAHLLPWLTSSGYRVITLSEAQTLSNGVGPLTAEALELHNQMFASEDSRSSLVDGDVLRGLLGPAASVAASTKGHTAPPSPVKGSQVGDQGPAPSQAPNTAVQAVLLDEEERRRRAKAERYAAMDKRAGIDRRLVEMSAADKRRLERIEREKKEAEKRRARRQAEEVRAKERYEAYVREQAEKQRRAAEEKAEAAAKAEAERIRRQKAVEEIQARQEAEKARMERLRQERLLAEAAQAAARAADADANADAMETASVTSQQPQEKAKKGLLGRVTSKLRKQLPGSNSSGKQQQSSGAAGTAMPAAIVATAADRTGPPPQQPLPLSLQQQQQDGQLQLAAPSAPAIAASLVGHSDDADDATILLTAAGDESELAAAAGSTILRKATGGDGKSLVVVPSNEEGVSQVDSRGRLVMGEGGSCQQLFATGEAAAYMVENGDSAQQVGRDPSRMHISDGFLVVK